MNKVGEFHRKIQIFKISGKFLQATPFQMLNAPTARIDKIKTKMVKKQTIALPRVHCCKKRVQLTTLFFYRAHDEEKHYMQLKLTPDQA